MKTLFISHVVPRPLDSGIKLRVHHLLRALSAATDVTLACFTDDGDAAHLEDLRDSFSNVMCVPRDTCGYSRAGRRSRIVQTAQAVLEYCNPTTLSTFAAWESGEARALLEKLAWQAFDLVWVESLNLVPLASLFPQARTIIDLPDVEHRKLAHRLRHGPWSPMVPFFAVEYLKLRNFERRLPRRHEIAVCSEADRQTLGGHRSIHVVPNGVSIPDDVVPLAHNARPTLLFIGTMSYLPNADAMRFFVTHVLPRVRHAIPDVRLVIVGINPPPDIRRLHDGGQIVVTDRVDSVVPYLTDAHAVIVPIRFGGGTRIKILEAMAYGRPVVATTIGAEGLEVEPGKHLLIADQPDRFAQACIALLSNVNLRRRVAADARRLVATRYDWRSIESQVMSLVSERPEPNVVGGRG